MYKSLTVLVFFFLSICFCSLSDENADDVEVVDNDVTVTVRESSEDRKIKGDDCEYVKLCDILKLDGCNDGKKVVITKKKGIRKQFLILNGSPVLGFVKRKKKFTSCNSYVHVTPKVKCKEVAGLDSLNISASNSSSGSSNGSFLRSEFENILTESIEMVQSDSNDISERIVRANDCEFIRICDVTDSDGCSDGKKLVIKKMKGLKRQFLLLNQKPVLGFVKRKKKVTSCESFTDITSQVECKGVSGLASLDLSSSSNSLR